MQSIIEFVTANLVAITAIQQGLFSALSLACQLLGWKVASKVFGTLTTLDLGRVVRVFQAFKAPPVAKATLGSLACVLLLNGCAPSTIHTDVQKALVFEDQVHAEIVKVRAVVDATLPLLPVDKQADYQAKLAVAYDALGKALAAKDEALQAALAASQSSVDVTAVTVRIVAAVEDIISIVHLFAAPAKANEVEGSVRSLKARWVK